MRPTRAKQAARARSAEELGEADFALPGSLIVGAQRCGKPNCARHHDPAKLHGPYARWTHKVDNKTVTCLLTLTTIDAATETLPVNRGRSSDDGA